jgi:hypothetical protein
VASNGVQFHVLNRNSSAAKEATVWK